MKRIAIIRTKVEKKYIRLIDDNDTSESSLIITSAIPLSTAAMRIEIERLQNENKALRQARAASLSFKISERGLLSIYGMYSWPITHYKETWLKLLDMKMEIQEFIESNNQNLKTKAQRYGSK